MTATYTENLRSIRTRRNEILRTLTPNCDGNRYSRKQVDYAQGKAEREILAEIDAA